MKKLIVISAPSGAGKTTICRRLLQDFPQLVLSISSTTRTPRGQEKHGHEYFFVTREEFERMITAQGFAEWALVHGNYYGTSKDVIDRAFAGGKSVLLDIDVQGGESLRKGYSKECFSVFVEPPSMEILESRLRGRGTDSEETIQKRLTNARKEMREAKHFHLIVVNHDLETAYQEVKAAVAEVLADG